MLRCSRSLFQGPISSPANQGADAVSEQRLPSSVLENYSCRIISSSACAERTVRQSAEARSKEETHWWIREYAYVQLLAPYRQSILFCPNERPYFGAYATSRTYTFVVLDARIKSIASANTRPDSTTAGKHVREKELLGIVVKNITGPSKADLASAIQRVSVR